MRRVVAALATLVVLVGSPASAQQPLRITPLAERVVTALPAGTLYWRIENFPTAADARASAGPWSLVAESAGKVWSFTLGESGGATPGGTNVAEVGPIDRVAATRYLLRINEASGPPGSMTPIHRHPGSEAFFVLAGQESIRHPHGVLRVDAGTTEAGHGADSPMQVSSSGAVDLLALVMFVVDADKPFSSPATLP
jgi:hypothetical protein